MIKSKSNKDDFRAERYECHAASSFYKQQNKIKETEIKYFWSTAPHCKPCRLCLSCYYSLHINTWIKGNPLVISFPMSTETL